MEDRKQQVCVVTGGARGIGFGIARRMAGRGCAVGILDVDGERAAAAATTLQSGGTAAVGVAADVGDPDAVRSAMKTVADKLGAPSILVNNAGICRIQHWRSISVADWERVLYVNARGVLVVSQVAVDYMLPQRHGRIVTIVSAAALEPGPLNAHYAASKAAAVALVRSMAADLFPMGVTSNGVCPGEVATDLWAGLDEDYHRELGVSSAEVLARRLAGGRANSVDDVAGVVAFLASDEAEKVNGQIIYLSTKVGGDPGETSTASR